MAFLPTMSLFLLAAVNNAAEPDVNNAAEPGDLVNQEGDLDDQEEEILAEPAGAFGSCIAGTAWMDADDGDPLTAENTCENTFAFIECVLFPEDAKKCCPQVCNCDHICAGDSFKNVEDGDVLLECLESVYEKPWGLSWLYTWKRAKYSSCEKVYDYDYTPQSSISVALCCPERPTPSEKPADDVLPDEELANEVTARMLSEDEAEGENLEAESANAGPFYGPELREKMCGSNPTSVPVDQNAPVITKKTPESGDTPNGSASTFGFTALALMLITA